MWSKRKSASEITNIIESYTKWCDKVIQELFTGWFAIWEKFLEKGYKVYANDKNKYVIALLDQTINKGLDEKKCTEWVSREKFIDVLGNPDKYEDWYVWYVMCIWSFGNNQKWYLFGKDVEATKKAWHDIVIDKDSTALKKIFPTIPQKYIDGILQQDNWHKRRIALNMVWRKLKTRILELERLQQLERLEQLEQLQRLEPVQFTSLSYEEVQIPDNAIIYCDPPYKWTAEYKEWAFDHTKFWEWVREKAKTHKIFISEYTAPPDFRCIFEFSQKSTLQGWNQLHNDQPTEKLFTI